MDFLTTYELAKQCLEYGREYKDESAKKQALQHLTDQENMVGLLQLIYLELKKQNQPAFDYEDHALWLNRWRERCLELTQKLKKEIDRVEGQWPTAKSPDLFCVSIHQWQRRWTCRRELWSKSYEVYFHRAEQQLKRLKRVKKLEDLIHLRGIGPKTLEKIKDRQQTHSDG